MYLFSAFLLCIDRSVCLSWFLSPCRQIVCFNIVWCVVIEGWLDGYCYRVIETQWRSSARLGCPVSRSGLWRCCFRSGYCKTRGHQHEHKKLFYLVCDFQRRIQDKYKSIYCTSAVEDKKWALMLNVYSDVRVIKRSRLDSVGHRDNKHHMRTSKQQFVNSSTTCWTVDDKNTLIH